LGAHAGAKQYIRVLQSLASHPVERVERAIVDCLTRGDLDAAAILDAVRRAASDNAPSLSDNALSHPISTVTVRPPDLAQFDRLLSHSPGEGDADECRDHAPAVEGQPEATEVADDVGR